MGALSYTSKFLIFLSVYGFILLYFTRKILTFELKATYLGPVLDGQVWYSGWDIAQRIEIAAANTFFQKKQEARVTYETRGRSIQVDRILHSFCNLKIRECTAVLGG